MIDNQSGDNRCLATCRYVWQLGSAFVVLAGVPLDVHGALSLARPVSQTMAGRDMRALYPPDHAVDDTVSLRAADDKKRAPIALSPLNSIARPSAPHVGTSASGASATRAPGRPVGSREDGAPLRGPHEDKPISLTFRDAELSTVFSALAEFSQSNIIVSDKVRKKVSLHLVDVQWSHALAALLDAHGLQMERRGNVIWIAPAVEIAARERALLEVHAKRLQLEPLSSRVFELHYQRAEDVRAMIAGSGSQRLLSARGAANADPRTNRLFVTDVADRLDEIASLVDAIDRPTRQVLIEARIVEADDRFSRALGARMALLKRDAGNDGLRAHGAAQQDARLGLHGPMVDLLAAPLLGFTPASTGVGLLSASASRLLDIELNALEAQGRGRIVSSPRVITADRSKAVVEQGAEVPYQVRAQRGSAVQFRRATLKLEVEPRITPRGHVMLNLDIAKDSIGMETSSGPAINTKRVQTRVEVENGGTVAIGGIYSHDDRQDEARVPILGDIPLIGALFRHRTRSDRHSELMILITPTVVSGLPKTDGTPEPADYDDGAQVGSARPGPSLPVVPTATYALPKP